jgi:hypothetical protein
MQSVVSRMARSLCGVAELMHNQCRERHVFRPRKPEAVQASGARTLGRSGLHRSLTSSSGNRAANSVRTERPTTYAMPQPGMSKTSRSTWSL